MNFQTNNWQKVELTGCWPSSELLAQSTLTDSVGPQSARTEENVDLVNHVVLSQEIYATNSQNGPQNFDNQLRCYKITTTSLVAAFYWDTV